jgi:tetratricopeptide (TPR) repeat protein
LALLVAVGILNLANLILERHVPPADPLPLPLRRGMPHAPPRHRSLPGVFFTRSGQPVLPRPAASTLRILVLGGSSPFGYGVTRFRSYPGILQARLDDSGRPVEVVNLAFAAMDLLDCLPVLGEGLADLHPDLVLCALGTNETLRLRLYSAENPTWNPAVETVRQRLEGFALYRYLAAGAPGGTERRQPEVASSVAPLGPAHLALVRPVLRQNLEKAITLCRQAGVPLVLAIDPCNEMWPPYVDPAWSSESPYREAWNHYSQGIRHLQQGHRTEALVDLEQAIEFDPRPFRCLPSIRSLIREVASSRGVPVMEGQEGLRRRSPTGLCDEHWFYDNCHFAPPGNQAQADLLMAFLDQKGLLPPPGAVPLPPPSDPFDLERVDLLNEDQVLPPVPENLLTPPPDWKSPRFPWTQYQFRRRLPPEDSLAGRVARGHLSFSKGDDPDAVRWYREALRLSPERAVLWRNLGHALLAAERDREAVAAYGEFLRLGGQDPRLERLVKRLEQQGSDGVNQPGVQGVPGRVSEGRSPG